MSLSIINETKIKIPDWPYEEMLNSVLGEKYELSLVFVSEKTIHNLNKTYRQKNKPTDILTFPLTDNSGEIFIAPLSAKAESLNFNRPFDNFIAFLFIHGLWHLKGFDHSSTMESNEQKTRKEFSI